MRHSSLWNPRPVVRLLTSCVQIINKFPADHGPDAAGDLLWFKSLYCHFVVASVRASLARAAEDYGEQQLADYRVMRAHITAFEGELLPRIDKTDAGEARDLLDKLAVLCVFDFEAAIALEDWQSLGEVVGRAEICRNAITYQAMGDCLLRSETPSEGSWTLSGMRARWFPEHSHL